MHISTRNTSEVSCARSYRTLRDGSFEGHFSQALHARLRSGCPYGTRWQTFRKQHLAKACCEMSRRDGAIVAWHEVLGTAPPQKSRPVGCGVIRAGVPTDSMIGLTIFRGRRSSDTNRSKRVLGLPKETRRTLRPTYPRGLAAPDHTVPYGTVLSRGAVPGTSCQATIGLPLRDRLYI